jgi:L-cysteine:1D-myo-inositol 2-amino-2-deoxy-alpha-D-glucopyranoside ligase
MKIYNTLNKKIEELNPLQEKKVSIYVCGITPYDTTHLGHAFTYLVFDCLIRYLRFQGYAVTHTQNVTDINDRDNDLLRKAKKQNKSWSNLSEFWDGKFLSDMKSLNWVFPTNYLYASKEIDRMIEMIYKLIKNDFAYEKGGSVYLSVNKFDNYGKLSGLNKEQMISTARAFDEDLDNPEKKNPLDITLWRKAADNQEAHIPSFVSPFSRGRPGWHIECSAMSAGSLGEQIDIHGGGEDLVYPHHESEIVQSEGAMGKSPFAKYWIHTGTIFYKGEKMSKSLGNLVMVSDLLQKYTANGIRWALLAHNYRKRWEFNEKEVEEAEKLVDSIDFRNGSVPVDFTEAMNNDLDIPEALKIIKETESAEAFRLLGFKDSR